jgi:hypothetical protein
MAEIQWDQAGEREFETGVDHGVLYEPDETGAYVSGVAWNGLTTVTESPSGAESNPQYADNMKYLNLKSAEEFGATIEAYTYPDEFGKYNGEAQPEPGVYLGQQRRGTFGLSYRTLKGNDLLGTEFGYKLHLVWNCDAAPSERAYATVNDSPEAITFSWELTTTKIAVGTIDGVKYSPVASMTIDSTKVDADALAALEGLLYGTEGGGDAHLPTPAEVVALFAAVSLTDVNLAVAANQPTFVAGTGVITLPNVTGVQWKVNGVNKAPGAQPAIASGTTAEVTAHANEGYVIQGDDDWTFFRP